MKAVIIDSESLNTFFDATKNHLSDKCKELLMTPFPTQENKIAEFQKAVVHHLALLKAKLESSK
jgi:hypothetical protein